MARGLLVCAELLSPDTPFSPLPVVGGHGGVLADGRGRLRKPLPDAARGAREVAFYRRICAPGAPGAPPATLFPRFYGAAGVGEEARASAPPAAAFVELEDVTARFRRPCVMDVKVGATTAPGASAAKVDAEALKYPPQAEFGCRITGMRVYLGEAAAADAAATGEHGRGEGRGGAAAPAPPPLPSPMM